MVENFIGEHFFAPFGCYSASVKIFLPPLKIDLRLMKKIMDTPIYIFRSSFLNRMNKKMSSCMTEDFRCALYLQIATLLLPPFAFIPLPLFLSLDLFLSLSPSLCHPSRSPTLIVFLSLFLLYFSLYFSKD